MKRIFFFGYTDFAGRMKASFLCHELESNGYECFQIEPPCYALQIGEIVVTPNVKADTDLSSRKLSEPFILFCGMNGEELNTALAACKGNTRAILTSSNSKMTVYELSGHLLEEKKSIERRTARK